MSPLPVDPNEPNLGPVESPCAAPGARIRRKSVSKARPASAKISRSGRDELTVESALQRLRKQDLKAPYRFWAGAELSVPSRVGEIRTQLAAWMRDPDRVAARAAELSPPERSVLNAFLSAPKHRRTKSDLDAALAGDSAEVEVDTLMRAALVFDDAQEESESAWAVPADLADTLLVQSIADRAQSMQTTLTLKGHLDERYAGPGAARPMSPSRLREVFKMYANEAAAVARIERLPEGLRGLVAKVVLEFGGLLPRQFFERMETELPHWNQRRWAKILGESLVGTVERLDLGRYGIKHDDDTLIIFTEVSLAWFKRVAVPSDPDAPHDDASLGVDLVANISRFLAYLIDNAVRFTVKGEIFKTTEKRILTELIPNPGRELERSEVLQFIFHFCRDLGLIEATGERTFRLAAAGREWEAQELDDKLVALFDYITHDIDAETESIHHPAMRQILLTMSKRLEIGVWYDVMYLPFLARNAYIGQIDTLGVDDHVAALGTGRAAGPEDLQRLAWNLVGWVRKRLYLLGIVDLGYDSQGHPVAMRLTRIGARVLGMEAPERETIGIGRLVVTADFEVVLFTDVGDDADLTHDLDRFADRISDGALRQFKLSERSVHRGLIEGMTLARMHELLVANARTPVPKNVLQSLKDWALQAGLMMLDKDLVLHAQDPSKLAKFVRDAGVRPFVRTRLDETTVKLRSKTSRARYRTLFRDLGYLVELED